MANTINISDITSNVAVDSNFVVTGDGYFDDLMETVNKHLQAQYDKGYILGDAYARAYVALAQQCLSQSIQFAMQKRQAELQTDIAETNAYIAEQTKEDKINQVVAQSDITEQELLKKIEEVEVAQETTADRIEQVSAMLAKTQAETSYIDEQETQLINSVEYNNKIKALDALSETYGTFGAGGLTLSSDMWGTYFSIVNDLSTASIPTSTTVTKVT